MDTVLPKHGTRYTSPSMAPLLTLTDLHISVAGKEVVHGVSLTMKPGEVHAIMGPNGSGKSSLVSALMGHPLYTIAKGSVKFNGKDLLKLEPHERAQAGLFLAFQYPKEISGVTLRDFLFAALNAHASAAGKTRVSPLQFKKKLMAEAEALHIDPVLLERSLNKGFSGGEKKKAEILQLRMLSPKLALLDETDSGLDVDALKIVAEGVNRSRADFALRTSPFGALVVTHYARLLEYIVPDHVHVMVRGKIVESGDKNLAHELERSGYAKYGVREKGAALSLEIDM